MRLAHRIAAFPAAGHAAVKDRVNAISLAPAEDFRYDSDLFGAAVGATREPTPDRRGVRARPADPRGRAGPRRDAARPGSALIGAARAAIGRRGSAPRRCPATRARA